MLQTLLVAIASVGAYFGLTLLIQHRVPTTKEISTYADRLKQEPKDDTPPKKAEQTTSNAVASSQMPPAIIGRFKLDVDTTSKHISSQKDLPKDAADALLKKLTPKSVQFDGKVWTVLDTDIPYTETPEILQQTATYIKLKVKTAADTEPVEHFIQWDQDGFWLSRYEPFPPDTKKILIRERYQRQGN